jgi:hypothetical protein
MQLALLVLIRPTRFTRSRFDSSLAAAILTMFISSASAKPPFLPGSYKSNSGDRLEIEITESTELIPQYYLLDNPDVTQSSS